MKIYIASLFDTRERLLPVRDRLNAAGHRVISSWLAAEAGITYGGTTEQYHRRCAERDLDEVREADWVFVDTCDVSDRGGQDVELGIALALGKLTARVGPPRNVFHTLVNWTFDSWDDVLEVVTLEVATYAGAGTAGTTGTAIV